MKSTESKFPAQAGEVRASPSLDSVSSSFKIACGAVLLGMIVLGGGAAARRSSGWLAVFKKAHPLVHGVTRIQPAEQAVAASTGTFKVIDVPGAGMASMSGTIPTGINSRGSIIGSYTKADGVLHGFVRTAEGAFATFDASNTANSPGRGTVPVAINTSGDVAGVYVDSGTVSHGFIRTAAGKLTVFEAPGAGTVANRGTVPMAINDADQIVGFYSTGSLTENSAYHGFLRDASGAVSAIDDPVAGTGQDPNTGRKQGTQAYAINAAGEIAGSFVDANMDRHGFVRTGGVFRNFDPTGADTSTTGQHQGMNGTSALGLDSAGDVTGSYPDSNGARHGFIRTAGGAILVFDPAGSSTGPGMIEGTVARGYDPSGAYLCGIYGDSSGVLHGFVRDEGGVITAINAPSAGGAGTSFLPGTAALGVNEHGEVTGGYADSVGALHGFLFTPSATTRAATPVFKPIAGTYPAPQSVKLTDTTSGAAIHYTLNGKTPTAASTKYTAPITVSATTTIHAIAVASGYADSAVASATYTIHLVTATPVFTPIAGNYSKAQSVAITDATSGAAIYFTLNGTAPTKSSTRYTAPIRIAGNQTIRAIAIDSGHANSAVAVAAYKVGLPAAVAPKFSVGTGNYKAAQTVRITDSTAGATIYYTTNGSAPTTASTKYTTPLTIAKTTTLKAIAASQTHSNSAVTTAVYTFGASATGRLLGKEP